MSVATTTATTTAPTARKPLRFGFWMQLWAAGYATTTVYPNPGLTALSVTLIGILAALIYDTRPVAGGSE